MMQTAAGAPATTTITAHGGLRFSADIRGHRVETDQPEAGGGLDSAPTPLELLAAALGTCVALYATQFCTARGLPADGLRVSVATEAARAPKRIAAFTVTLDLPDAFPASQRDAIERVVRSCPVHNTLTHAPAIALEIREPATSAA